MQEDTSVVDSQQRGDQPCLEPRSTAEVLCPEPVRIAEGSSCRAEKCRMWVSIALLLVCKCIGPEVPC